MSRFAYVRQPLRKRILRRRYLLGRPLPQPGHPRRTICAYAKRMSRFSRVQIHYPDWVIKGDPPPVYDFALARELLERTDEFPDDPSGMLIIMTEYRHALGALVRAERARTEPAVMS
jgi:hypothetical protein